MNCLLLIEKNLNQQKLLIKGNEDVEKNVGLEF